MATLTLALVAGMAVGSGPGRASVRTERGLGLIDVNSAWKGTLQRITYLDGQAIDITIADGLIHLHFPGGDSLAILGRWVDEGKGNCRAEANGGVHRAIYKWEYGRLFICLAECDQPRPTVFRVSKGQILLILQAAKPAK